MSALEKMLKQLRCLQSIYKILTGQLSTPCHIVALFLEREYSPKITRQPQQKIHYGECNLIDIRSRTKLFSQFFFT